MSKLRFKKIRIDKKDYDKVVLIRKILQMWRPNVNSFKLNRRSLKTKYPEAKRYNTISHINYLRI